MRDRPGWELNEKELAVYGEHYRKEMAENMRVGNASARSIEDILDKLEKYIEENSTPQETKVGYMYIPDQTYLDQLESKRGNMVPNEHSRF